MLFSRMLGMLGTFHHPEKASSCVQLWQTLPLSLVVMAHLTSLPQPSLLLAGFISQVNSLQTSLCLEHWFQGNQVKAGPKMDRRKCIGNRRTSQLPSTYKVGEGA